MNLALALAVSAGAVPRPGDNVVKLPPPEPGEELAAPAARQAGDVAAQVAQAAGAGAGAHAHDRGARHHGGQAQGHHPADHQGPAAATPKAGAPAAASLPPGPLRGRRRAKVARRVPTAAEIQGVIARLKKDIPILGFVSVTPAQIDQAGDQVCTAFDNGQTFAQVKATGLSMIPASITVPAATADWAVRQAVTLYCPGHANKLV